MDFCNNSWLVALTVWSSCLISISSFDFCSKASWAFSCILTMLLMVFEFSNIVVLCSSVTSTIFAFSEAISLVIWWSTSPCSEIFSTNFLIFSDLLRIKSKDELSDFSLSNSWYILRMFSSIFSLNSFTTSWSDSKAACCFSISIDSCLISLISISPDFTGFEATKTRVSRSTLSSNTTFSIFRLYTKPFNSELSQLPAN